MTRCTMKKYFFAKGVVEIILKEQIHRNEVYIMKQQHIPVNEKFILSIREASEYFNIGIKNMRRLAENHTDTFAVYNGNRILIIRSRCEDYILSCLTEIDQEKGGNKI